MWSWTLYFLHHFLDCFAFWKLENYSLRWNYTVACSSEKDYRISSYGDITCSPNMFFIQNVWRLFKPNDIISQEIGYSHFVIYWGNSVSFSLSQQKILNEWLAESQADCLIGNRWAPGRTWSRKRWGRRRGRRGMRRPCCWQGWMEAHSIWSLWRDSTALVKDQPAHPSRLALRKMVSSLKSTPLEAL